MLWHPALVAIRHGDSRPPNKAGSFSCSAYQPNLVGKTLLLKAQHICVMRHAETKLELNWKFLYYPVTFIVPEGTMQATGGKGHRHYPIVDTVDDKNDHPGKICLLVQQRPES